jgi:hypothetical protein
MGSRCMGGGAKEERFMGEEKLLNGDWIVRKR